VIKTEETMRHLSRNGLIIWLKRDLERLYPTPERPLSLTKEALDQLYTERLPLYERYADLAIDNNGEIEKTADCILVQAAGGKKTI
jgi:shikimate kinase